MKRFVSILLVGAAVTTAALAFAGNQTAAAKDDCCPAVKQCCPTSCPSDT